MSKKKSSEATARESKLKYDLLAQNIRDVVWTLDLNGRITYVSPSVTAITGYSPEEYYARTLDQFLEPESAAQVVAALQDQLSKPPQERSESFIMDLREKSKNGPPVDIEVNASWMYDSGGAPSGIVGVSRNITARKRAEQELRESEERFRAFVLLSTEGILIHENGVIVDANQAAADLAGFPNPESLIGKHGVDDIPFTPVSRKVLRSYLDSSLSESKDVEILRQDGTLIPLSVRGRATTFRGRPVGIVSLLDVTDRKNAEEERILNAWRLSALLELNQMSDASIHDLTHFAMEEAVNLTGSSIGYIAFASQDESVLTMYAWSEAAMAECTIDNKPRVYPVNSTGLWGEAVRQRRPIITNNYAAANPWKKGIPEGHVHILRHLNVPVFDRDRIVIVAGVGNKPEDYDEGDVRQLTLLMEGMWRIVTQRRAEEEKEKLQEQLAQAAKMEAVGRLAGGVAHDFNNLLTTILGYSEMILSQLNEEDPLYLEAEEIHKAGERAASLTQQLLAFSRKQVIKPRIVDLNEAVKEARKMLDRLIGENIKLVLDLEPDLGRVKVDPHQVDQVLLNLAVNARDAMPDGGTLTIATGNITFDKGSLSPHSEIVPGSYSVLSVTDTGMGMNDEIKSRLFEPFFSTKENGKGTGLGLAMVYGIAKQNGGSVSVHSEQGLGTVFRLYLPSTDDKPAASVIPLRIASPTGNETVLLVEDDDMVRRLAQRVLTHLGYEVLQAYDIEDAIRICEEYPTPIHLLLTDVIMPGMNGVELYDQLRTTRTGIKALFMSGYAEDVVVRHGVLPEGTEFIQKPFNMEDLASRVRQTLDNY
jgi:PAS domain S-box-containing protein